MQLTLGCDTSQTLMCPQVTWGSCGAADSDSGGLGQGLRGCISDEAQVMQICGREGPDRLSGSPAVRRAPGLPPFQHSTCCVSPLDDFNATCMEPPELAGWPISQAGNPLRYMCITHLDSRDYIFLLLVGFCIFAAGTVAAWLTGMCAVVYQSAHRKSNEAEDEDEQGQRVVSRRIFQGKADSGQDGFPQLI